MEKRWFTIQEDTIHILPVLHERVELADVVRLALQDLSPDIVAVELPGSLRLHAIRAIERLPQVSILLYESLEGAPIYWTVSPADPLVEAVRWALERGVPVHFVDVDVDAPLISYERVPDSYAALRLGPRAYYRAIVGNGGFRVASHQDRLRERGMAFRLQELAGAGNRILFVCGMAHAERILEDLKKPLAEPMDRQERKAVQLFHLHPDSMQELLWDPPLIHALFEWRRQGIDPEPQTPQPDLHGREAGPFRILRGGKDQERNEDQVRLQAAKWCASRCHRMPGEKRGEEMTLHELLNDGGPAPSPDAHRYPMDRQRASWRWIQRAAALYAQKTGERIQPWQLHLLMRFSRNYALLEGRLLPDFYQWVAAARACVDENFAYEVWSLGCVYPWQREVATDLHTLRVRGEELWLGTRRMRIRPRVPRRKRPWRFPIRSRKKESRPGEWLEAFDGQALCSYPPEDIVVERFGGYLRNRGVRLLSEERSRVEPFVSSLLDGIDLKETLRNWQDGKLYVRESRRVRGGVGAVVVIFDSDPRGDRYPYCMTWHGEHEQESDMAFYATSLGEQIVGPGISRCEYGGFVMTYPPRRMWDVWHDPDYAILDSKPEILLLAALDYSLEPHVVYVAAHAPRSWFHTLASRMGLKIMYLPVGQFSSTTLKKIRVFHVLSGYDKRDIAREYIHKTD
jgi:hypothetical protein